MAILKTKKAVAKFNKALKDLFDKYGVVETGDEYGYTHKLVTKFGTLLIYPRSEADRTSGWWIFTRFDEGWDKEKVFELVGSCHAINEHSGKWNILGHTAEQALKQIEERLRIISSKLEKNEA